MRIYKLTKVDYKHSLVRLYKKMGVIYGKHAMVSDIYMAKEDIATFRMNLLKEMHKENPQYSFNHLKTQFLPFTWFNIGPSELLKDVIKKGYVLIDDKSIECQKLHGPLERMKIFDTLRQRVAKND